MAAPLCPGLHRSAGWAVYEFAQILLGEKITPGTTFSVAKTLAGHARVGLAIPFE